MVCFYYFYDDIKQTDLLSTIKNIYLLSCISKWRKDKKKQAYLFVTLNLHD